MLRDDDAGCVSSGSRLLLFDAEAPPPYALIFISAVRFIFLCHIFTTTTAMIADFQHARFRRYEAFRPASFRFRIIRLEGCGRSFFTPLPAMVALPPFAMPRRMRAALRLLRR